MSFTSPLPMLIENVASGTSLFRDLQFVCADGLSVWYHQSLAYQQFPLLRSILGPLGDRASHPVVVLDCVKVGTMEDMLGYLTRGERLVRDKASLSDLQNLVGMLGLETDEESGDKEAKYTPVVAGEGDNPSLEENISDLSSSVDVNKMGTERSKLKQKTGPRPEKVSGEESGPRCLESEAPQPNSDTCIVAHKRDFEEGNYSKEKMSKRGRKTKKSNEQSEEECVPRFKVKPGRKPNLRNTASAMMVGDIKLSFNLAEDEIDEGQFEINLGDLTKDKIKKQKLKRKIKFSPKTENVVEGKKLRKSNVREKIDKIMDKVLEEKKVATKAKKDDGNNDVLEIERRIGVVKERIACIGDSLQENKGLLNVEQMSNVKKDIAIPKKKRNKRSNTNVKSELEITKQSPKLPCDDELRKCILDYTGGETGGHSMINERTFSEDDWSEASFSIDSVKDTEKESLSEIRKGTGELTELFSDDGSEAPLVMDLDD